ncbi:hypothetical protein LZ30DRAFT_778579 [Colletotrichum cereale]|nr:hypothetical protein LZ30DRAFT_778579 [Colletotrichum cereale]
MGYGGIRSSARKVPGDEVGPSGQGLLDQQGEINSTGRGSGHPGSRYTGGNLAL